MLATDQGLRLRSFLRAAVPRRRIADVFSAQASTFRYSLQGVALMLIFSYLLCVRQGLLHRALNASAVDLLGRHSYSFYLVHFILVDFLSTQALLTQPLWLRFLAVVAGAWTYAAVMERLVERPMQAWRSKLHVEAVTATPPAPKLMESTLEKQI